MGDNNDTLTFQYDLKVIECPCGSGRLPEKCCGSMSPRTYSVDLDIRNYHESEGLAIGKDFSLKRVVNGKREEIIGNIKFTQSYKRKKNHKVLVKGESSGDYVLDPNSILLDYDHIFAIDTNTKLFDEYQVNVTGVVHSFLKITGNEAVLNYIPLSLLEFWDAETKPEILGWYAVINSIIENQQFANKKIGVIVDSELASLDDFNKQLMPLFEDFYLPDNFKFIYASADNAMNITNRLIKLADKFASDKLNEVLSDVRWESLTDTPYPCRYFRQWTR